MASVIINNQMQYLRNKDLGFNKDQQVVIPLRSGECKKYLHCIKRRDKEKPQIENAGASLYYPGIFNPSDMPIV